MTDAARAHRDRIRQRVGAARRVVEDVRRIVNEYRDGRAASACMADIEIAVGKKGTSDDR